MREIRRQRAADRQQGSINPKVLLEESFSRFSVYLFLLWFFFLSFVLGFLVVFCLFVLGIVLKVSKDEDKRELIPH